MTPVFLPHTVLDAMDDAEVAKLPAAAAHGRAQLRDRRDRAIAEGAHVLLLLWTDLQWALLAVEAPVGMPARDSTQLIPSLLANPMALERIRREACAGQRLAWLTLMRPGQTPPLRRGHRRSTFPLLAS